ncbi:MAG TPA: TonB-dependent receptor [Bacteroidota bacterium]|nr:TonB-dependent receptor [Bacteroidota bacterium]
MKSRLWKRFLLMVLTALASSAPALIGQELNNVGVIEGTVIDGVTNERLAGVNVVIVGTTLGASTDADGRFRIERVPIGTAALKVSLVGYTAFTKTDIVVTAAKPAELTIPLIESTVQVDAVQVTASYFQKLPDTPLSTLTQSNEEIRRLPGGLEDVVRAISILPGVAQVQAGRNDLIVRGGAPSENLFLIDNIEVPNINHFGTQGASGGPLSFVNLDFVENTTFSTGGFGVRYGDRLSSVLTIDLRDGRRDRIGGKATISASQFGLNLEGPSGPSGGFIFSARRSYLDFIFKAAGFGFVPEYWDFLGKANYRLGSSDRLTVLAIAALDDVKFLNDTQKQRFDNSRILGSNQNEAVAGITWQHLFTNGLLTMTAAHTYMDFRYGQSDSLLVPIFRNTSVERESSLRSDVLFHATKSTEVTLGVLTKVPDFSSDVTLRPFATSFGDSLGINASYATTAFKGAVYGQVSQDLGFGRVTIGGRLDYFDLIEHKFAFSPRLSVTVPITVVTNVNASVGRYAQAPSYIWLVSNSTNRNLGFILANQYVLGVDHTLRADTRISLEGYIKEYSDYPASTLRPYLVLANTGAGYGGSDDGFASFGLDPLSGSGSGESHGVELLAQKRLSEIPCYGTVSVSYNVTKFRGIDGVLRASSWDQRWILNIGGGYLPNSEWEFSTKFRYVTGRPYTPFDPDGAQVPALYNTLRIAPNHSLDVRVDRRWSFARWTLVTYIDIQNIYNRKPLDVPRYNPETQRAEQDASIGILPSIGISAEF